MESLMDTFRNLPSPPEEPDDHISAGTLSIPANITVPVPEKTKSNMSIHSHRTKSSSSNQSNYVTIKQFDEKFEDLR